MRICTCSQTLQLYWRPGCCNEPRHTYNIIIVTLWTQFSPFIHTFIKYSECDFWETFFCHNRSFNLDFNWTTDCFCLFVCLFLFLFFVLFVLFFVFVLFCFVLFLFFMRSMMVSLVWPWFGYSSLNHNENMPYPVSVWKCLPHRSPQPVYCILFRSRLIFLYCAV